MEFTKDLIAQVEEEVKRELAEVKPQESVKDVLMGEVQKKSEVRFEVAEDQELTEEETKQEHVTTQDRSAFINYYREKKFTHLKFENLFPYATGWNDPRVLNEIRKQTLAIMYMVLTGKEDIPETVQKMAQFVMGRLIQVAEAPKTTVKLSLKTVEELRKKAGLTTPMKLIERPLTLKK